MAQFIIKRQIIKGIHSSRRTVYEYLYSQGGVWGERKEDADVFDEHNINANLLHFRNLNAVPGNSILSTTKERI